MESNYMYMGIGIFIALGGVYVLRRLRSFLYFGIMLAIGGTIFGIGPFNHMRTNNATSAIASTYEGAENFQVDFGDNEGTFDVNGQNLNFKMEDGFKTIGIYDENGKINSIDVNAVASNANNMIEDVQNSSVINEIANTVKEGVKFGIDEVKKIAPEGTKWPSDYLTEQQEESIETE